MIEKTFDKSFPNNDNTVICIRVTQTPFVIQVDIINHLFGLQRPLLRKIGVGVSSDYMGGYKLRSSNISCFYFFGNS